MKKIVRLSENDLHRIVKESIKKALKEDTMNNVIIKKWNQIEQVLGSDGMISELFNYLDADIIADFVNTIENTYDIEENDDDSYDEFINNMNFQSGQTCG
jgi:hypothetical protein